MPLAIFGFLGCLTGLYSDAIMSSYPSRSGPSKTSTPSWANLRHFQPQPMVPSRVQGLW